MPAPAGCSLSCLSPTHGPFQGWLILCRTSQLLNPLWVQAQRSVLVSGYGDCGYGLVGGGVRGGVLAGRVSWWDYAGLSRLLT